MLVEFCSAMIAGPFTLSPGRICSRKKTGVGCHWPALNIGTVSCALNGFYFSGKTGGCPPNSEEESDEGVEWNQKRETGLVGRLEPTAHRVLITERDGQEGVGAVIAQVHL